MYLPSDRARCRGVTATRVRVVAAVEVGQGYLRPDMLHVGDNVYVLSEFIFLYFSRSASSVCKGANAASSFTSCSIVSSREPGAALCVDGGMTLTASQGMASTSCAGAASTGGAPVTMWSVVKKRQVSLKVRSKRGEMQSSRAKSVRASAAEPKSIGKGDVNNRNRANNEVNGNNG